MVIPYWRPLKNSSKFAELRPLAPWWAKSAQKYVFRSISTGPPRFQDLQQDAKTFRPRCWSLLSSSSSAISSTVSSPKIPISKTDPNKIPLLVVLLTPTHLSLLEDSNAFIPNLLRQEVDTSQPGQVFDVIAAVVDRIPHPQCTVDGRSNNSDAVLEYSGQDGSEGVSVAVLSSCSAAPDLWSFRQESKGRESMTIQQRCTLSFAFSSVNPTGSQGRRLNSPRRASQVLQLPVANTLFQNGKTSTLLAQQWVLRRESDSKAKVFLTKKKQLSQQTLNMVDLLAEKKVFLHQFLRFNLTQITPARVITAAIGNIIRKIRVCGSSKENTPASEELERAISSGIAKGRNSQQPAGIWALVKPRDHTARDEDSCLDLSYGPDLLENAILSGCRLHKVLSGGGGWGEKQGLLALDPDSDYLSRRHEFESDFADDQDDELEKLQALGEVVKPGDMVTFYVSNPYPVPGSAIDPQSDLAMSKLTAPLSLMFGSLPSKMDAMPNATGTEEAASVQSNCVMIRNHFGMLSEHGMSLKSTFTNSDVKCVKTKLDAPYTLCTIRETARSSECNEASGPGSEAPQTDTQKSGITERLDRGLSTTDTSLEYQGALKGSPRDINMRWTQNTAPRPPNIDIRQRRPLTTDSRSHSRSHSRIESDKAPKVKKKGQWSVEARFRQRGRLVVYTPCDQRTELSEDAAPGQLVRKLPTSAPHQGKIPIGNYSNDKPHKGRVLIRGHFGKEPPIRKTWPIIEAPTSKPNDQANVGRVSAKGLLRSLDRPGLIREGAREVDDIPDLEQGPPIRKFTVAEPLVPGSRAGVEEIAVPEASVRIRTYRPRDEKDMSTDMQVPTLGRKQRLLEGHRASGDTGPGKEQPPDEEQASKAQTLPPIEEQIARASIQNSEAEHATKAKVQVSDEEKDLETLIQVRTVNGSVRKGNGPDKLSRVTAREAAHLKESVTHIFDQEAARQAIWEAEAKKSFGKFRFVSEVRKDEQPGGPYPEFVKIRKHLSVGDVSKPRIDQALENRRLGTRLDAAPYDNPSDLEMTKWTDEIKTDGNVYQINLKLSARKRSNARDELKSSAESHSDKSRRLRHLYRDASNHPGNLPIMLVGGNIVEFELGHELPPNGYSIKKHLSKASASARTRPTSSRHRAQDLHRKYRPHLSPDETP